MGEVELASDSRFRGGAHQRVLFHSPPAFDAATYEVWVPLLNGGTVVIAPDEPSFALHVTATTSGHDVMSPLGQPRLVAAAIREVVRSVRTGRPLGSCADVFAPLGGQCMA